MRVPSFGLICTLIWSSITLCHGVSHHSGLHALSLRNINNATNVKKRQASKGCEGEMTCVDGICHISRGGAHLDKYDDEYDEDEEDDELPPPRKRPPPRSRSSRSRGPPPRGPPPDRRGLPPSRGRPPPPRRRPKPPSVLSSAAGLAKKTVGLTTSAAVTTLKGSGKAALYLVSPKHVTRREVWGVWRFDQQVNTDSDTPISCAANVELTPRGDVLVKYQDQIFETTYLFREKTWPKSCSIEFEARAFQGPNDEEPVTMKYKGVFRRKLANSQVIKIVGHIYELPRKGLWRGGRTGRKVGTFVARRRLAKRAESRQPEEDDEYDYEDDEEAFDLEELDDDEYDEDVDNEYDEFN